MLRAIAFALFLTAALAESLPPKEGRIVGGRVVSIYKHPYQISLRHKACDTCVFTHICGGVILNSTTILTAGHCVYKKEPKSLVVVAATDNRSGSDGFIALIDKIKVFEEFIPASLENNIALIFLSTALTLQENLVSSVQLPSSEPFTGSKALVSGWGAMTEGGQNSNKLQEVEVYIINKNVCEEAYGPGRITLDMLCAGTTTGGKDACQYDSGGPLTTDGTLVGIVSWNRGCARPGFPGVYANVAYFRKWIDQTMQQSL